MVSFFAISCEMGGDSMRDNLKRMISYYKPYLGTFFLDMLFAIVASGISLVIPLVVGDITNEIPHLTAEEGMRKILTFAVILVALVIIQFFANYYISYVGHVMGAKMEYDMILADEDGKPVDGAAVLFCSDVSCSVESTGEDGRAVFNVPAGVYTIHIAAVPDGFQKNTDEYQTSEAPGTIVVTLEK